MQSLSGRNNFFNLKPSQSIVFSNTNYRINETESAIFRFCTCSAGTALQIILRLQH